MDWIAATCWAVIALAGLWALWALFWDRPRGRLRCRKCAYDMAGVGLTCPECGKTHASKRALRRTRRRFKTATAGTALILLSIYIRSERFRIYQEGAIGAVPTTVLVAFGDPQKYVDRRIGNAVHRPTLLDRTLDERFEYNDVCLFTRRWWARQLVTAQEARHVADDRLLQVYDLSDLAPLYEPELASPSRGWPVTQRRWPSKYRNERALEIQNLLHEIVQLEMWATNGGNEAESWLECDQLMVIGPESLHTEIQGRLVELRKYRWVKGGMPLVFPPITGRILAIYEFPELVDLGDLEYYKSRDDIVHSIEGLVGTAMALEDSDVHSVIPKYLDDYRFIVWTTVENHSATMLHLNSELKN